MSTCPSCAAENAANARFCNQCGTRLEAVPAVPARQGYTPRHLVERVLKDRAAMQGERKRVTVLFCDIKGSTTLAQQAGAEGWHQVLDRFFSILSGAVHRYEGTVNQYTGDGIMALFGAPIAHEDHAVRACLAALQMQAEVRRFADELRLERGLNLSMRVGLNTGEVIVGRIGDDLRMDYTAQGPTVNLAARMEHLCAPGHVLLARSTAALVQGYFELRSLGLTQVAGVEQPVEVYELEGLGRLESAFDWRIERGGSPLLGREAELAQLGALLQQALAGQGAVAGIAGAAGLGKSRLCQEFADAAVRQGVAVHLTRASPYERHQAMSAPVALLRSRMGLPPRATPEAARQRIAEVFPDLAAQHPRAYAFVHDFLGVGEPGALTPDIAASLRDSMMRELARWLPSSTGPQVIVFEDLHYLGDYTLEFLRLLAAAVAGTQTLLLLSWRDDAAPAALPPLDLHLALAPLDQSALECLAAHGLGLDESVAELPAQLARRAGGNPYFVEEAITALAETGLLEGERGDYVLLQPLEHWPMPETVHALIAARIDRLPSAHKAALQAAAVIGAEFNAELLEAMEPGLDAAPALRALRDAGFLRDDADGLLRFTQPLMREVAYDAQLESSRRLAHASLARVMERASGTRPVSEQARAIAHHWAAAGEWAQAGLWNLNAARYLAVRDARATLEQFQAAIQHLDRAALTDAVRRGRIAARAGVIRMAQFWTLDPAQIERAYAEARQLADDCGDPQCAAELMISYGAEHLHRGDAARAVELVREGVALCPAAERPVLVDRFRVGILLAHNAAGRVQDGLDLVNEAGGSDWLTRPIDRDNNLSRALMCVRLAWVGEVARAQDELLQCIAVAERDGRSASWMHAYRVYCAWLTGEREGVLEIAQRAVAQAQVFGGGYFQAIAERALGEALILLGRADEAIEPLTASRAFTAPGAGAYQFEAQHLAVLSDACLAAGRVDEAAAWAREAVRSAQQSGSRLWEVRAWLAQLALPPSHLDAAEARAGLARLRELIALTQGWSLSPRVDELEAARADSAETRAQLLARAREGYARIGAQAHLRRLGA